MYKICFVTTVSMTLKAFVLETAKYLHEKGEFDISFICSEDSSFEKSLPDYIHYYPVHMERGISLSAFSATKEIKQIFKRNRFDLVQYSTPNASLYASIAAKAAKIPVRLYCQWGIAYVGFNGLKRILFKMIEKMVCRLSTRIEPDSFGNLKFSQSEGLYKKEKGSVIWNGSASGVSLKKFDVSKKTEWRSEIRQKYSIPDEAFVQIFVGRITRDKGINELLEACQKLVKQYDDVYLLMVGSIENEDNFEHGLLRWSKNSPKVIYCGFTNEVEKYLSASDVYLLPSYREGFGSGVVEAESMGVPVIVSNIPGPTDAMKNEMTGLIVPVKDTESLYKAIKCLYEDKALRDTYSKNGIRFATKCFEQQALFERILKDRIGLIDRKTYG